MSIAYTGNGGHAEAAGSGGTIAVTLGGVVATDAIVGSVTVEDTVTISSVKDQTPTSAALDKLHDDTVGTQWLGLWSLPNSPSGSRTLTATFSASAAFRGIQALELSGAATTALLTGTPAANDSGAGTATAFDSSISTTPGVAGAFVLQVGEGGSHQPTVAGGFTAGLQDAVNLVSTGYLVQGAAAAVSPSFTLSVADSWSVVIAAYKPAGSVANTLAAAPGSYAITGDAASIAVQRSPLLAAPGAYAVTGDATKFVAAHVLAAAPGFYVLSGFAALLRGPGPQGPPPNGGPPPNDEPTPRRKYVLDARPGRGPTAQEVRARLVSPKLAPKSKQAPDADREAPDTFEQDVLDVVTVLILVGEL